MTNGSDPVGATQFLRRAEVSDAAERLDALMRAGDFR